MLFLFVFENERLKPRNCFIIEKCVLKVMVYVFKLSLIYSQKDSHWLFSDMNQTFNFSLGKHHTTWNCRYGH